MRRTSGRCGRSRRAPAMSFAAPTSAIGKRFRGCCGRSIDGPAEFIKTNVEGTCVLLEAALAHWRKLPAERAARFRFHHVSTDEVFGSLGMTGSFTETTRYQP